MPLSVSQVSLELRQHGNSHIGSIQTAGCQAVDDFFGELDRRMDREYSSLSGPIPRASGVLMQTPTIAAGASGMAALGAAGVGIFALAAGYVVQEYAEAHAQERREECRRHLTTFRGRWRQFVVDYCGQFDGIVERACTPFAESIAAEQPRLMEVEHLPEIARRFLVQIEAPGQYYFYMRIWNHLAAWWYRNIVTWHEQLVARGRTVGSVEHNGEARYYTMSDRPVGERLDHGRQLPLPTDFAVRETRQPGTMPSAGMEDLIAASSAAIVVSPSVMGD